MGNKILVEFDRTDLTEICNRKNNCLGCDYSDRKLIRCNLKEELNFAIVKFIFKEQNNGKV